MVPTFETRNPCANGEGEGKTGKDREREGRKARGREGHPKAGERDPPSSLW